MARIRSLKPEMWMSPQVMNLSHSARLLFIGLITQADDEGRGTADARRLKAAIFGGDDITSSDVRRMLDECSLQGLVVLYEHEQHGILYVLPSWGTHQSIDRPRKSVYPNPPTATCPQRTLVEDDTSPREGLEGKGVECAVAPIVEGLNVQAWDQWVDYRKKIRKPLKQVSMPAAQRELAAFGSDQEAVVQQSIGNGYQGLFPLKHKPKQGKSEWM